MFWKEWLKLSSLQKLWTTKQAGSLKKSKTKAKLAKIIEVLDNGLDEGFKQNKSLNVFKTTNNMSLMKLYKIGNEQ